MGRLGRTAWFFLVAIPLGTLLAGVALLAVGRPEVLLLAVPTGRRWQLLANTVLLAGGVSVAATVLGLLGAVALTTGRAARHRFLGWFPLVLAPLPPYIHALAWNDTVAWAGGVFAGRVAPPPSGMAATFWVETMALLPFAVALGLVAMGSLARPAVEAARLYRTDMAVLARIVLPLAAPFLAASAALVFLLTLTAYDVPSLYAVTTYPLEIFAEFSASHDAGRTAIVALPALGIAVLGLMLVRPALRRATVQDHGGPDPVAWDWPVWFLAVQGVAAAVLAVQLLVPLAVLVLGAGPWRRVVSTLARAAPEVGFSLLVAGSAAALAVPLAAALARRLGSAAWWGLAFLPLAVPAPLVGVALVEAFNPVLPTALLDGPLLPVLADLIRFTPFATFVLLAGLGRRQRDRLDAVRVFQPSPLAGWRRVRLRLETPTLLAAAGFVFALSLGELGATLLVAPPGRSTLAIRIYNYLHYGGAADVRALCLLLLVLTTTAGLGAASLVRWSAGKAP